MTELCHKSRSGSLASLLLNKPTLHHSYISEHTLRLMDTRTHVLRNPSGWITDVCQNHAQLRLIPKSPVTRHDLWSLSEDNRCPTDILCLLILAWGGLSRKNGRLFNSCKEHWLTVAEKIRTGKVANREDAYKLFFDLRQSKVLKGIRPAFYTKLICFLNRRLKGYIMDQWTAKSVNLLTSEFRIALQDQYVADTNAPEIYEYFCQEIEAVAATFKYDGFEMEERFFSYGGRKKGLWRSFLITNYPKTA